MAEESSSQTEVTRETVMQEGEKYVYRREGEQKKIAVIGAGPAGLGALRRAQGLDVTCFEQAASLGGTWVYTDSVAKDPLGYPVTSFLYKNLKTNLPKEVMNYPGFPYKDEGNSYIEAEEVLRYLQSFAAEYDLEKYIKYRHRVTKVKPLVNLWSLSVLDLETNQERHFIFDAIIVCSGPNVIPVYPQIEMAKFSGIQIHSKDYKVPDSYEGKAVLLIGLGPSGIDIGYQLADVASKVFISTHKAKGLTLQFPESIVIKPSVKYLYDKVVEFEDESSETIDVIIHCTGYTYNFPFLDPECGITVDQYVFPLYKHFISIERPTLAFIGLPKFISHLYMVDYQVRCFLKWIKGEIELPSKEEMLDDLRQDVESREEVKQKKKDFHKLGKEKSVKYFSDLAEMGQLEPVPPVQLSLFNEAFLRAIRDFGQFRSDRYSILDDETYQLVKA